MIRKAVQADLADILSLYASGRNFMHSHGNPGQWTNGYPEAALLQKDIENGELFVMEDAQIYGVFLMTEKADPTYTRIHGAWHTAHPYITIHRICGDGVHRGILREAVAFAETKGLPIRIDTHENNLPMQRAVLREGFRFCGVIRLQNGDPRLAYDRQPRK